MGRDQAASRSPSCRPSCSGRRRGSTALMLLLATQTIASTLPTTVLAASEIPVLTELVQHMGSSRWDGQFGPFPIKTDEAKFTKRLQQARQVDAPKAQVHAQGQASWARGWGLHTDSAVRAHGVDVQPKASSPIPQLAARPSMQHGSVSAPLARRDATAKHVVQVLRNTVKDTVPRGRSGKRDSNSIDEHNAEDESWIAPALTRVMEDDHRWYTGESRDNLDDSQDHSIDDNSSQRAHVNEGQHTRSKKAAQDKPMSDHRHDSYTKKPAHAKEPPAVTKDQRPYMSSWQSPSSHMHAARSSVRPVKETAANEFVAAQVALVAPRQGPHHVAPMQAAGARGPTASSNFDVGPRKAPIAKATRDFEKQLLGTGGMHMKDEDGDDDDSNEDWDNEDGDLEDANPAEEVREFETDMKHAFDWNKITFATIPLHQWAWWVAALFVILTCIVSGQLIWAHLDNYEKPEVQKYVVRIIFMTPIYAIVALLSLTFDNAAPLLNVLRDCYEAFTLYNFVKMLYVWCGGERKVMDMMAQKKQMKLPFPLHWTEPWAMGDELFYNCKFGVLQYVLIIPVCAVIAFITIAAGAYEGPEWYSMDLWITLVAISSATWAIYCLITFYLAMQEEIESSVTNALGKFLCVKAVVFLCFYQGLALKVVLIIGYIPSSDTYSEKRFINAIENWLICLEMFIIAICFSLVFPVEEIKEMKEIKTDSPTGSQGALSPVYGTFEESGKV